MGSLVTENCINRKNLNANEIINILQNDLNNLLVEKDNLIKLFVASMNNCIENSYEAFKKSLENAKRKTNACIKQVYYKNIK